MKTSVTDNGPCLTTCWGDMYSFCVDVMQVVPIISHRQTNIFRVLGTGIHDKIERKFCAHITVKCPLAKRQKTASELIPPIFPAVKLVLSLMPWSASSKVSIATSKAVLSDKR